MAQRKRGRKNETPEQPPAQDKKELQALYAKMRRQFHRGGRAEVH